MTSIKGKYCLPILILLFLLSTSLFSTKARAQATESIQTQLLSILKQLQEAQSKLNTVTPPNSYVPPENSNIIEREATILVDRGPITTTNLTEGFAEEIYSVVVRPLDSSVTLQRIDVHFTQNPWRYFEHLTVQDLNGKEIRKINLSESTAVRVNGEYRIRFADVNFVANRSFRTDLVVRAKVKNSIPKSKVGNELQVFIPKEGILAVDSRRIISYEPEENLAPRTLNRADPKLAGVVIPLFQASSTLSSFVRVSSQESTEASLLAIELRAQNSSANIKKMFFEVETGSALGSDIVNKAELIVDNKVVAVGSITDATRNLMSTDANGDSYVLVEKGNTLIAFDNIKTFKLSERQKQNVSVRLFFNPADGVRYSSGQLFNIRLREIISRNAFNKNIVSGRLILGESKNFELATAGFIGKFIQSNTTYLNPQQTRVQQTITFSLSAFGNDVYIPQTALREMSKAFPQTGMVGYRILNGKGQTYTGGVTTQSITSTNAEKTGSMFYIPKNETRTFKLDVTYNNAGQVRDFYSTQIALIQYRIGTPTNTLRETTLGLHNYSTSQMLMNR